MVAPGRRSFCGATSSEIAYSLSEVGDQLQVFDDEPMALAIIGTAAFAGLRQGEIRGLWVDDEGDVLKSKRQRNYTVDERKRDNSTATTLTTMR